jgi:hypothetical protein
MNFKLSFSLHEAIYSPKGLILVLLSVLLFISAPMTQVAYALDGIQQTKKDYTKIINGRIEILEFQKEALEKENRIEYDDKNKYRNNAQGYKCLVESNSVRQGRGGTCSTISEELKAKLVDILRKQIVALKDLQVDVDSTSDPAVLNRLGRSINAQYGLNYMTVVQAKTILALESASRALFKGKESLDITAEQFAKVAECSEYVANETSSAQSQDSANETDIPDREVNILPKQDSRLNVKEGNGGSTSMVFTFEREGNLGIKSTVEWVLDLKPSSSVGINDIADSDDVIIDDNNPAKGVLSFEENQRNATLEIKIKGDVDVEKDEKVRIILSNPSQGTNLRLNSLKGYYEGMILNDDGEGLGSADDKTSEKKPCEGLDPSKAASIIKNQSVVPALNVTTFLNATASSTLNSLSSLAEAQISAFTDRIQSIEGQLGKGGLESLSNIVDASIMAGLVNAAVGGIESARATFQTIGTQLESVVGTVQTSLNNLQSLASQVVSPIREEFKYARYAATFIAERVGSLSDYTDRGAGAVGNFVRWQPPYWFGTKDRYCALDISRVQADEKVAATAQQVMSLCNQEMTNVQRLTSMTYHRYPVQIVMVNKEYQDDLVKDKNWCRDDNARSDISLSFPSKGRIYVCGTGYLKNNPTDTSWIIKDMARLTQRYEKNDSNQWFIDAIPIYVQKKLSLTRNEDLVVCNKNETYKSSPRCAAAFLNILTKYDSKIVQRIHLAESVENKKIDETILKKASSSDNKNYKALDELFDMQCKVNPACTV